jgi:hypothetical protein
MNTSSQSTIDYLNFITRELNYIPLALLILGTIGNISNILVFSRPLLRKSPCSIYFISCSIVNFGSLYVGLLTPFLGLYNLDPTQTIDSLCKIRFYLRYSTITLSTWFILLACIDRYLSSSININIRLWSSVRLAKRIVYFSSIICFIFPYTQVFYCYTVNQKNGCTFQNNTCQLLNNIILFLINSGLPPILMVLASMLTIRNVKYSNHIAAGRYHRRRDIQLIQILFIQVFILVLFSIPVAIQKIYTLSTSFMIKNSLRIAIENLINQISIEISYISTSTTFYVYSLTNKKYRQEAFHILSLIFTCYRDINRNRVQPIERSGLNLNETMPNIHNESYKLHTRNRNE